MLSGNDGRTSRASLRVAALPLGTMFIGSTLIALVPSASADTLALDTELRPVISLAPERLTVETGETATLDLKVAPSPDRPNIQFCLYDLRVDSGFSVGEHEARTAPANAKVTGAPTESVTVTAMVDYVAVNKGIDCALVDEVPRDTAESAPVEVEVVAEKEPDPSEEPSPPDETDPPETEDPTPPPETGDPSEPPETADPSDPPETSDPSNPPDQSGSPEPPPKTTPPEKDPSSPSTTSPSTKKPSTKKPSAKKPATRSPRQTTSAPRPAPPHSPVTTRSSDSEGDRPALPTGPADIPELDTPSSSRDLADLPTVVPGEDSQDGEESTTVAAGDTDVSSSLTPLVMFAFLLLLLFLSVPLSPFRRVRTGTGYMGRRRKN
ncbi:hypothetical protein GCM10009799_04080 [Nocardiopsis rhodophaea]|uniref:Uncharacterized protein n=1 Tax=Nocardiopsis rhodophaea TaxID=280238 RepID=A0ABN2S9I6_9ACTN